MHSRGRKLAPYLFISPSLSAMPSFPDADCAIVAIEFYRQRGIGAVPRFEGLDNYIRLFTKDELFFKSLINTTYYALGSVFVIVPLALLLGLILHRSQLQFREFFRLFFYAQHHSRGGCGHYLWAGL